MRDRQRASRAAVPPRAPMLRRRSVTPRCLLRCWASTGGSASAAPRLLAAPPPPPGGAFGPGQPAGQPRWRRPPRRHMPEKPGPWKTKSDPALYRHPREYRQERRGRMTLTSLSRTRTCAPTARMKYNVSIAVVSLAQGGEPGDRQQTDRGRGLDHGNTGRMFSGISRSSRIFTMGALGVRIRRHRRHGICQARHRSSVNPERSFPNSIESTRAVRRRAVNRLAAIASALATA